MKKYLIALLAMLFTSSVFALITSPMSNQWDNTGTISNKDKVWIKVMNNSGASVARGKIVVLDTADDDGGSVTTTTTRQLVPHCMADETIAAGKVGKCLVFGYTDQLYFDASTTAAVGEKLFLSTSNAGYAVMIASASIGAYDTPLGRAYDASAASGQVEAFINTLH